jgi:hypothetical protein
MREESPAGARNTYQEAFIGDKEHTRQSTWRKKNMHRTRSQAQ